jgi:hypothetical protein
MTFGTPSISLVLIYCASSGFSAIVKYSTKPTPIIICGTELDIPEQYALAPGSFNKACNWLNLYSGIADKLKTVWPPWVRKLIGKLGVPYNRRLRVRGSPHPLFMTLIYHSPQRIATLSVSTSDLLLFGKRRIIAVNDLAFFRRNPRLTLG